MLEIYTDGACIPNPGVGGWAFVVYENDHPTIAEWGGSPETTNNVMELTAMLEALHWLRKHRQFARIWSDSQYVVKGCNEWRHTWARNDWYTKQKKLVANLEIWKEIAAVLDQQPRISCEIGWVKGHAGIAGNEHADDLSMKGAAQVAGIPVEEMYDREKEMRRAFSR